MSFRIRKLDAIKHFLNPASIAVVGAGERPTSSGGAVLRNLLASGYKGRIVPVNPKGGEILGLAAKAGKLERYMIWSGQGRFLRAKVVAV